MRRPSWLTDAHAISFWDKHKSILTAPQQIESFAVLCQVYSDYRQSQDPKLRLKLLGEYYRFASKFHLFSPLTEVEDSDSLTEFFGGDRV